MKVADRSRAQPDRVSASPISPRYRIRAQRLDVHGVFTPIPSGHLARSRRVAQVREKHSEPDLPAISGRCALHPAPEEYPTRPAAAAPAKAGPVGQTGSNPA